MHLSNKQKTFCQFFSAILESRSNFEHFLQKDDPDRLCISKITDCERRGYSNDLKFKFTETLQQATWQTVETTGPFSFLLTTVMEFKSKNVSLGDM